jgi:hypothetical protein
VTIELTEDGRRLAYGFDDLMRFHGGGSPGGVAIAFKVLERALPLLDPESPCHRREIAIATGFGGPGARDAFEMATRAVSDGRYEVDTALERFVFRITYRARTVTLTLREGFVTDEFARLAFGGERTAGEDARLELLKRELAQRVLAVSPEDAIAVEI